MSSANAICLFVLLDAVPYGIVQAKEDDQSEVLLNGMKFVLLDREAGFYDLLRNREGSLIGIRFSFFDSKKLLQTIASLEYIYVDERRQFAEIYLQGYRSDSILGHAEQTFGDDAVFRSESGVYALQLGVSELSDDDIQSFRNSGTRNADGGS